jgi:hypothetical protein
MGRSRRPLTRVRQVASVLAALVVVEYLVLPQLAVARRALDLLRGVDPLLLVAATALEGVALVAYAQLTRAVLPREHAPRLGTSLRIVLATLSLSHVVPGGSAAGTSLGFRLLTATGVRGTDAGFALATQGIGSALVLNLLLWAGLVASIPLRGFQPLTGTVALVGALLLGGFGLAVVGLTRGEDRLARLLVRSAARLPFVDPDGVEAVLRRVAERLRALAGDRRLLARAGGWAAANWLADAAALWLFLAAFGELTWPDALVVSYGLAYVLAAVPITPGGLGVVEAVLTSSLVGFGIPRGVAILGVVSYRLVNFWLPIPLGAAAYVSLRVGPFSTEAERALAERARARQWAREHGLRVPGEHRAD